MKTILALAGVLCWSLASAQTVTIPIQLSATIPLQSGSATNFYFITTNVYNITTNVYQITQVITNASASTPLEILTSPLVDAQHHNRRLYASIGGGGSIAFTMTNFDSGNRVELAIDNPQLMTIIWPKGEWRGPPVSSTNTFPRVLIDNLFGRIELTQ